MTNACQMESHWCGGLSEHYSGHQKKHQPKLVFLRLLLAICDLKSTQVKDELAYA
jgi:hypothetical protein